MEATRKESIKLLYFFLTAISKKLLLTIIVTGSFINHSFSQLSLTGKWIDVNYKDKQLEIYAGNNNKIYGKNEKGIIVLKDFVYDTRNKTYCGILINPDDWEEFTIVIKQTSPTRFTFIIRKFLFTKEFVFERRVENKDIFLHR